MWKIIGGGAIEKTVEKIIYKTVRRVIGNNIKDCAGGYIIPYKRLCKDYKKDGIYIYIYIWAYGRLYKRSNKVPCGRLNGNQIVPNKTL